MSHEPDAPANNRHDVLRYRRVDETRLYTLVVLQTGVELWRTTTVDDEPATTLLEDVFKESTLAARAIEEIQRSLSAGGWKPE